MRAYIIRRLLLVVPTLLAVTIAVFMTVRFIPGSTIDLMIAEMMGAGSEADPKAMEAYLRHELGLDQPVHIQYLRWLGVAKQDDGRFSGVLQGDLGHSLWQ
ncbi:MAG: hypothetical protein A2147_03735 [Chloroflexi bacterium RBG_16_57_8]|nr:MAG: hypothetical protein A2147_03735 [Chloroflexi bacterium RBG_16_57_8]